MKILFDNGTPVPLRRYLYGHSVDTAARMGWATLRNGELLARAEENGYDLIITTDQQWPHQLNLANFQVAVLVLLEASWPRTRFRLQEIRDAVDRTHPGGYQEVAI
ncbi:MAG: hypothetical protein OXN15_06335 [Chloroflexota bacterium]|nr:hypothetical protein [Chloroflexota bacterium]MDE2969861.1 hypothetical protein [Chloroflexota bacterium]